MNLPTTDQTSAFARHVITAAASVVATLATLKVISGGDATQLQTALDQIGHGAAEFVIGISTLVSVISGLYAGLSASPLWQLIRGSRAVAADPAKIAQLQSASIADKAPIAALTDKMPEVAHVNTMPTSAGQQLAAAVPSATVRIAPQNSTL